MLNASQLHLQKTPFWHKIKNMNEKAIKKIKEAGLKVTNQKVSILNIFISDKSPLSVNVVAKKLNNKIEESTIYRSINKFVEKGILKELKIKKNRSSYELIDEKNHHHHISCNLCEKIEDVKNCNIKDIELSLLKKSKLFKNIKNHSLEFFGICKECSQKSK